MRKRRRRRNPVQREIERLMMEREIRLQEQLEIFIKMGFRQDELSIVEHAYMVDEVIPDCMLRKG